MSEMTVNIFRGLYALVVIIRMLGGENDAGAEGPVPRNPSYSFSQPSFQFPTVGVIRSKFPNMGDS